MANGPGQSTISALTDRKAGFGLQGMKDVIKGWDQKSASAITDIYDRYHQKADFIGQLLRLMEEEDLQRGASWLVKHWLELKGHRLEDAHISDFLKLGPHQIHWEAKLHFLQSLPYLEVSEDQGAFLEPFIRSCIESDQKLLRAWGYNGLHLLWGQDGSRCEEVRKELEQALQRESAGSVKARIRNCLKSK